MNNLRIIKLGGSIITDKTRPGIINRDAITALATTIAQFNTSPLIIVHGAGSCGHPEAAAWKIQAGVTKENARGIFETHQAVSALNREVVQALRSAGLEAVSLHPFGCSFAEDGRLCFAGVEQISALLKMGVIPVLHGDVVMDKVRGACIVSGDRIVPYLAVALQASDVGIITLTGGVLSKTGTIVPEITRESVKTLDLGGFDGGADVTGGMQGKVAELLDLADARIKSHIFAPEYLKEYLTGEDYPNTTVL